MSNNNSNIEPCPHCGDLLGPRQICRHLAPQHSAFSLNANSPLDSSTAALGSPDLHNPNSITGDVEMDAGGDSLIENFMHNLANVTLGEDGVTITPIPQRRNPPVTIEEWPDPEDNFAHLEASDEDLPPEPSFIECSDTPLGEYPEDEALMDDEELLRFLQENLGDRVDKEWLRTMCPQQCKDLNSFLIPLLEELLKLEKGVSAAPIVLESRLPDPYYEHFLLMQEIIVLALQFELTFDDLDRLQHMVNTWVAQYKEYYYQYDYTRLPACPLTIHALLHLPQYIQIAGPLWASWAFVMEQFCGHILPAVKNCVRPYEHLDNYIQRRAQMQAVLLKFHLPSLAKPRINYTYAHGEKISSRERTYPQFNMIVLGAPVCCNVEVNTQLMNQLGKYFGLVYAEELHLNGQDVRSRISTNTMYELLPDANASIGDAPDAPVRRVHYGQLLDIYYVEFITDLVNDVRMPYLLARVQECQTNGLNAALPKNPLVIY
ncbi:hypothetical protein BN14_06660 [Rhizoctonia solani AG-1 IB]|uniref:Uncharacterized protein n=1 Tax=Thanatephorus cucumeris (strain AG1-IB / isolate 7/3/14) TaxID=1108050 RepID=M5C9U3_THACB|nr:hypothetical protein BN14_06660 [Rhizoctonia solani AG-1 IB]